MSLTGTLHKSISGQSHDRSTRVFQTSIFSAISRASSISTPRYRTVLSILWPAGHSVLVPKKQLRRPEVPRAAVDQSHLCPPHRMGRKLQPIETDTAHPF